MVAADVAVVGGGLQGLVLLRELTAAGYGSVLVTNGDLGSGQTLHSHGLLNSGVGLRTGVMQHELHELTLPYLRRLGVAVYGQDRSFLLASDAVVDRLSPVWEANQYQPERTEPSSLSAGVASVGQRVYRVPGLSVDKRSLVVTLAAGLDPFILRGEVVEEDRTIRIREKASGEVLSLDAQAVVVAAGCGTKGLLRRIFGVDEAVLGDIAYTKVHMICLRAPMGVLPDIGTLISADLLIAAHPPPDVPAADERSVTWYVTPADPDPTHVADAPDDGAADVDIAVVATGIKALLRLVPQLSLHGERIRVTVFAGYKQDVGGESTRRACELVDSERNVIMALPSVLANAVPNALEVLTLLDQLIEATPGAADVRLGADVAVGRLNEDVDQSLWMSLSDFARAHGTDLG